MGHSMDYKTYSDNEDFERETNYYENENEAYWSGTNYGSLEALKTFSTDANGSKTTQIGDATPMTDMLDNANNESKFAPTPNGLIISKLPGVQPSGHLENLFSFSPLGSGGLIAPRNYYLSSHTVTIAPTKSGNLEHFRDELGDDYNINVFQVPYGENDVVNDNTGVVTEASKIASAEKEVRKSIKELKKLATAKTNVDQYAKHILNSKGDGLSPSFDNLNNMINNGLYADSYKSGLSVGLGVKGSTMSTVHGVKIKTEDGSVNDAFDQFNYIYKVLRDGSSDYYSPALVKWGQKNADSIIHTLMANYFFQKQFAGTDGEYTTPIRLSKWDEKKELTFYNDLVKKGKSTKEPFYLYTVINPKADTGKKTLSALKLSHIQPDLSYIYSLYTAIHTHVWVGASGNFNVDGAVSQDWQDLVDAMDKKAKDKKVDKKSKPKDANSVSKKYSDYEHNTLVSGLSSQKGGDRKAGTSSVYPNKQLVDSFRILLSKGETASGKNVVLNGKSIKITSVGDTKYSKKGIAQSQLYQVFSSTGGDTYDKWASMINSSDHIPLQPAIFRSKWDTTSSQAGYVMMPILMGGTDFTDAIETMLNDMRKDVDGAEIVNLSYTNRYIMAFNLKSDTQSKSTNTKGVTEVTAGKNIGSALDKSMPIVLTGYLGGETFSVVDYFKVYDSMSEGRDNPNLKVKGADGKMLQMKYLNLFKDFFTIKTDTDFVGKEGKGKLEYIEGFDFEALKTKYSANKSKSSTTQISPNYETFFNAPATED